MSNRNVYRSARFVLVALLGLTSAMARPGAAPVCGPPAWQPARPRAAAYLAGLTALRDDGIVIGDNNLMAGGNGPGAV